MKNPNVFHLTCCCFTYFLFLSCLLVDHLRFPVAFFPSSITPSSLLVWQQAPARDFPGGSVVKNPAASAGDVGLVPESGRPPGEADDNPLQYSCLGNPMGRGACLRNLVTEPPLPGPSHSCAQGPSPGRYVS